MGVFEGESTAEIEAGIDRVWEFICDVERAPEWQGGLSDVTVVLRDGADDAILCEVATDAKVMTIKTRARFTYARPTLLSWVQEHGPLKAVRGHWKLEDLGDQRTQATYWLEVDLGRLGLVFRGPLIDLLRVPLVNARAGELKKAVEAGS